MKIQPYLDKLNSSNKFKEFISKNPDAYFSAGFFMIDLAEGNNLHQIDYYLPKEKKIVTFMLDKDIEMKKDDLQNDSVPKGIEGNIEIDLDVLKGIVEDEMKNHTVTTKLIKIIAVIQNIEGKKVWNLNCLTSDMGIIKVHVDDSDHSVLKFENVNLFDAVKKLK